MRQFSFLFYPLEKFRQGLLHLLLVPKRAHVPALVAGEYVLKNLRHGVILPLQLRIKRRKAGVAIRFYQVGQQENIDRITSYS